jgi:hypothetical protein
MACLDAGTVLSCLPVVNVRAGNRPQVLAKGGGPIPPSRLQQLLRSVDCSMGILAEDAP